MLAQNRLAAALRAAWCYEASLAETNLFLREASNAT